MIKAVLFDFDGVLGDSFSVSKKMLEMTLRAYNFPLPDANEFPKHFGLPRRKFVEAFLPENHSADLDAMEQHFHELSVQMIKEIALMPGAKKLLQELKNKYALAVISSRGGDTLLSILEHHNIKKYFQLLIHKESVKEHKPHPEGILKVLSELKLQKSEVVFVGDAKEDVGAAKNAGIISILLGKENKHNADYHIKSLSELPELLKTM